MIQVNITKKGAKSAKRPDKKGFNFYYIKKERKGSKKATKKDEHNEAKKLNQLPPFLTWRLSCIRRCRTGRRMCCTPRGRCCSSHPSRSSPNRRTG